MGSLSVMLFTLTRKTPLLPIIGEDTVFTGRLVAAATTFGSIPAVGMGAEIGLSYDGKVKLDVELLEKASSAHKLHDGTKIVYLDPQRITDISTPQARRGRIIYSHFKEIGWE